MGATRLPMGYMYSQCHQMINQQRPKRPWGCRGSPNDPHFSTNPRRPETGKVLTSGTPSGSRSWKPGDVTWDPAIG